MFTLDSLSATRCPCLGFRLQFHVGELKSLSRKSWCYPSVGFTHLSYLLFWLYVSRKNWKILRRKNTASCAPPQPALTLTPSPRCHLQSNLQRNIYTAHATNIYRKYVQHLCIETTSSGRISGNIKNGSNTKDAAVKWCLLELLAPHSPVPRPTCISYCFTLARVLSINIFRLLPTFSYWSRGRALDPQSLGQEF